MIGHSPAGRRPRHRTRGRRLFAVAALVAAVAGWGALVTGTTAQAAACGTTTGVTVVVDFGSLGGGARTGCASAPSSGLSALTGAGHSYTFVPRQAGMVCTIDRLPDPCNGAPVTAYWSYWHASPGGSWSYSSVGPASYRPRAGSVEGWAFGAGRPPSIRPPGASKPKASATPEPTTRTTTSTPSPRTASGSGTSPIAARPGSASVPVGSPARTTGSSSASPSATTGVTPGSSGPSAEPSGSLAPSGPATDRATSARPVGTANVADTKGTGDTRTLAIGAALIAVIGAGAGAIAWRRRAGR